MGPSGSPRRRLGPTLEVTNRDPHQEDVQLPGRNAAQAASLRSGAGDWSLRWARMSRPLELRPTSPVAVALSGGADSVFLLHLIARSIPRPKVMAIHVDHGLRGSESGGDAEFCARLCAKLGIPFARRIVEIDPEASDLEARAREARYRALAEEATAASIPTLLTGHHEDDAVETLLMRWMRGTDLAGLAGLRRETVLGKAHAQDVKLRVLRPLVALRREEVRSALRAEGLEWREDSSNTSTRFTRNRVRHQVLPEIEASCGEEGVENFFDFARAIESFEDEIADRTAHIQWEPVAHEAARRSTLMPDLGGRVRREVLTELENPFMRRALGRLIGEGTGQRPGKDFLSHLAEDISEGRTGRREVHQGWSVQLQSDAMHLTPPSGSMTAPPGTGSSSGSSSGSNQASAAPSASGTAVAEPQGQLPVRAQLAAEETAPPRLEAEPMCDELAATPPKHELKGEIDYEIQAAPRQAPTTITGQGLALGVPGSIQLPDGRSIHADFVAAGEVPSMSTTVVEIDAAHSDGLRVRFERPGDRFWPLGAPGHKPLRRFLGSVGIPREERGQVPVVVSGEDIVWVAGVRIADQHKVTAATKRRIRLSMRGARGE